MRVSIVIPAFNEEATLSICLAALLKQTRAPDEIIVVDNRSTDRTRAVVEDFARRSALIHLCREERQGDGPARNRGVAESTGDILVFTDADCVPNHGWLERLVSPYHADPTLEATAGMVVGHEPKTLVQRCLSVTRFTTPQYAQTVKGLSFPPITFATANFSVRRDVLADSGGFDDRLLINTDVDLCCTILRRNGRIQYVPDARVGHIQRDSLRKMIRRQFQYGTGLPPIFRKHFADKAWLTLPFRGVLLPLPSSLRPCWVNLGTPDRVLLFLGLITIWQPWTSVLVTAYAIRLAWLVYRLARVRGVHIAPWELPLITAMHVGEFIAFTAGCLVGALRSRVLCVV